jgi:hypothetical protein
MCRIIRPFRRTGMAGLRSDLFPHLFRQVLRRCIAEGLVGGEAFAVAGSLIQTDAAAASGLRPKRVCLQTRRAAPCRLAARHMKPEG